MTCSENTVKIYCEACDTEGENVPADIYVCNICKYEFVNYSDYCPRCDRESMIEYCDCRCTRCDSYIPSCVA